MENPARRFFTDKRGLLACTTRSVVGAQHELIPSLGLLALSLALLPALFRPFGHGMQPAMTYN